MHDLSLSSGYGPNGEPLPARPDGEPAQYITFTIGDEHYGVDIMLVREIRGWTETTALPNSPRYMRGVINLRGVIVPIYDLRARFGLGLTQAGKHHVVIVVTVGTRLLGVLVDAVSDILKVMPSDMRPVPEMDRTIDDAYLSGLAAVGERVVAVIDLERLFEPRIVPAAENGSAGHDLEG